MTIGWLLLALLLGLTIGSVSGLIPGVHVNTMALLALAASPWLLELGLPLLLVAGAIVVAGVVHTFLDYLPGALLGAPDDDVALAALPAHQLLRSGRAAEGVAWSARGSQLGLLFALPLLVVGRVLLGPEVDGYERLKGVLPVVLAGIVLLLLSTESTRLRWPAWLGWMPAAPDGSSRLAGVLAAAGVFGLAGALGVAVFGLPAESPVGMPSTLLMPALAGLFGVASLLDAWQSTGGLPEQQRVDGLPPIRPLVPACAAASVAGGAMGVLPGMTAAQATVMAQGGRRVWQGWFGREARAGGASAGGAARTADADASGPSAADLLVAGDEAEAAAVVPSEDEFAAQLEVIAVLSAVNTACTVMVLGFLAVVGRARSGAALALVQLFPLAPWVSWLPPADVVRLLALTVAGGLLAVPLMLLWSRGFMALHDRIPQRALVGSVLVAVVVLSFLSTGIVGLAVLVAATTLGLVPPRLGVRRSHAMGVILLPVLLRLWEVPLP